jgi:NADH-ubiquinone oxidoreductase chain 6
MIIKNILLNILALGAILSSVLVITSKNPVISVLYLISLFINTAGYLILIGIGFVGIAYILVYIGAITVLFLFVIMMINIKLVDILEVGREYTKNLPLALSIGFVFLYLIISITSSNLFVLDSQTTLTGQEGGQLAGLNNISLQIITYPLELLTDFNKLFLILGSSFTGEGGEYLNESISNNFITIINSIINPIGLDINFVNFLQIEMLGQGLYTYGAYWLILSSIILLLSMIAPIILSTPASNT